MKNTKSEKNSSSKFSIGIIVLGVLFVGVIIGFVLMIPRLNLPSKVAMNEIAADKPMPDGTVQNGDLWNFYKDKTLSEIKSFRPNIIDTGSGMYIIDQYGDLDRAALFEGMFEEEELKMLFFILSDSEFLCGTTNNEDRKKISDFADWCIEKMGFSKDNMEYMENGDSIFLTDYSNGIRCSYEVCPGNGIKGFACADISAVAESEGW